ncbi:MAG TPA: DegT/DnrJ/EryC1/StrS family aminotransferase, partial [Armatimonadota bacterium]|nr:DegT/DnrJ/EryC1/StrS family aminotransferase [Armatimonadota bacterium]
MKKEVSDFRYESGAAKVAWSAVGEPVQREEIADILRFLIRPAAERTPDFELQLQRVLQEIDTLLQDGELQGKLTLGNQVQKLEAEVAGFLGAKYATFLTNATAGFELAEKYVNLQPGDEVIAPAITFIATISYPLSVGAKVVLADVDPRTLNMDPEDVRRKITPKTKVIL